MITRLLNLGHAYAHFIMLLYPTVVLVLEADFQRSYGELLALATPGFIAFGVGALPAGWLGDRWSRRGMLMLFFLGSGAAALLTGLASSLLWLTLGLTLIGIFASIYHPVGTAMVVEGRRDIGKALSINGIAGNLGVAGAPLVAGVLIDQLGWRGAFIVPGLIGITLGIVLAGLKPCAPVSLTHTETPMETTGHTRLRVLFVIAVTTLCGGIIFDSLIVALPKLLEDSMQALSATDIGTLAAMIFAVAAFAQYPVGILIDNYSIKPVFLLVVGLKIPIFLIAAGTSGLLIPPLLLLAMLLVFGEIPLLDAVLARLTTADWRSRAYALKNFIGFSVSALSIPLVAILYETSGNLYALFPILAGLALLIVGTVCLLPKLPRIEHRSDLFANNALRKP